MKNYRLIDAVYSKADPIDLVDPQIRLQEIAMDFYLSDYEIDEIDQYSSLVCEGDLLLEWSLKEFVMENLGNLFQFIIGAGLEVGLTLTGFGAPLAPFAEMANDAIFLAMGAGGTIAAVKNLFSGGFGKLKEAFKSLLAIDVKAAPSEIYQRIKNGIDTIGSKLAPLNIGVEAGLEKMTDVLRDLIRKMAKTIGDIAGVFSPIPGTDVVVQEAIVATIDNTYNVLAGIVDKMPEWMAEYFYNPGKLVDQLVELCSNGIKLIGQIKVSDNEEGFFGKVWGAAKAVVSGPLEWLKKILKVDKIADKLMGWLEKAKSMLDPFLDIMMKIVPAMWQGSAALSILATGDYDLEAIEADACDSGSDDEACEEEEDTTAEETEETGEDKETKKKDKPKKNMKGGLNLKNLFGANPDAVEESYVREEIGRNYHTLVNEPYSWKDYSDIEHNVFANEDGTFSAKVTCLSDDNLSSNLRTFPDSHSAAHWAREQSERIRRHTINNITEITSLRELYNLI